MTKPIAIGVDIETNWCGQGRGSPYTDQIVLVQVNDGTHIMVDEDPEVFEDLLNDPDIIKIFHNAAFDLQYLMYNMWDCRITNVWDTMLAEQLINLGHRDIPADLASVVRRYCNEELDKGIRETFINCKKGNLTQQQIEYAKDDVRYLLEIQAEQREKIALRELDHIMWVENRLVVISARMMLNGIGFDPDAWNMMLEYEADQIPALEDQLWSLLSESFHLDLMSGRMIGELNLDSTKQVAAAFQLKGEDVTSTSESVLKEMTHPAAKLLIEYREHKKRMSWNYPDHVNPVTGRIHPEIHQMGARTGRFSYSSPNLQNVPKENVFRHMFVPGSGRTYVVSDYGHQELRIIAEISGCPNLRKVCWEGDPHAANARIIYSDPSIVKGDPRRTAAKSVGFLLTYGGSLKGFAHGAGLALSAAKAPFKLLKKTFKRVDEWGDESLRFLLHHGYIKTIGGRRRHIKEAMSDPGKYATVSRNTPIQGTAADMMKLAMVYIDDGIRKAGHDAQIVLCIHDEVVVECSTDCQDKVKLLVESEMIRAGEYYIKSVPTVAEAMISKHWEH